MKKHNYSDEEVKFLEVNIKGQSIMKLQELFNAHFDLDLSYNQLRAACKNRGLKSGFDGRFPKGNIPFNKGARGVRVSKRTEFKKGHIPANYRPVGSERVSVDGYVEVKIEDHKKWRLKHQVVWEKSNGSIPKGFAVIFSDGDKSNLALDNLMLISRRELLTMNQHDLISKSKELTETGKLIANVYIAVSERKKNSKKCV